MFGNEYLRGNVKFTFENTGLVDVDSNASTEIKNEEGSEFISQVGTGIAYDTRGGGNLPTKGQLTSLNLNVVPTILDGGSEFYGLHLKSAWYFKGLRKGHVIELHGQAAVVDTLQDGQKVPYLYRHALGGNAICEVSITVKSGHAEIREIIWGATPWSTARLNTAYLRRGIGSGPPLFMTGVLSTKTRGSLHRAITTTTGESAFGWIFRFSAPCVLIMECQLPGMATMITVANSK